VGLGMISGRPIRKKVWVIAWSANIERFRESTFS
jgi:hypothetical protein